MISTATTLLTLTSLSFLFVGDPRPPLSSSPGLEFAGSSAPAAHFAFERALPEAVALPDRGRAFRDEELTPHFASGRRAKAKAAFDEGRWPEALRLLSTEGDEPPVRFLRALIQLELGQKAAAAEHLLFLAEELPVLRDDCLIRAGAALEGLQYRLMAADAYQRVSAASSRFGEARLSLSRVLLDYGDPDGAGQALDALLDSPETPRAQRDAAKMALASVASLLRDLPAQKAALVEVYAEGSEWQARAAAARLILLGGLPATAVARRALWLIEANQPAQALSLVEPHFKAGSPDALACVQRLARGLKESALEDAAAAESTLGEAVKLCEAGPARARALLSLAQVQSALSGEQARRTLDRLLYEYSDSALAPQALLEAAKLELGRGELAMARARLGQLGHQFGGSELAADALFRSFWLSWREDPARADLAPLTRTAELPVRAATALQRERARYWIARALQARGESSTAASAFANLARDARISFYGQLAISNLEALNPDAAEALVARPILPPASGNWPLFSGPEGAGARLLSAIELARLGLAEAPARIMALSTPGQSPERARLLFHLLRLAGDEDRAGAFARQAARAHQGEWTAADRPLFAAAFPRAFGDLVGKHAQEVGIEPSLLQALIREESAFNPRARSWAGAMGLAQLMVPTAKEVAGQVGAAWPGVDGLFEPDFNLKLGSRYLANVLKRFSGNQAYAVASYNAGPNRVARWVNSRPPMPLDEWVEEIPIAETRWYVKRVLSSEHVYRRLASSEPLARVSASAWRTVPGHGRLPFPSQP